MSNMVVNTNVLSINAHRNLSKVGTMQAKASGRLSSGLRVNSAADDAAGLAISEKMRGQIRGLDQAARNAQDGISMIQTAEGSMQEIENMVQRIRELTIQASNDSNEQDDRAKIGAEVQQLLDEVDQMTMRTEFNKKKLATGCYAKGSAAGKGNSLFVQVGANEGQGIQFNIGTLTTQGLSNRAACMLQKSWRTGGKEFNATKSAVNKASIKCYIKATSAQLMSIATKVKFSAIGNKLMKSNMSGKCISMLTTVVEKALQIVTDERASIGVVQNRVEHAMNNVKVSHENLSAAESRIRDTDMAKEMMNLTRANVLNQAATSMLAQANQAPQGVLQLLQ